MEQTAISTSKTNLRPVLWSVLFMIAASGMVFYLFNAAGPISQTWHIDLSFVPLPFIGYYIVRLVSRLTGYFNKSKSGAAAALIINDIAFCFFSYNLLSRAVLFTRIPILTGAHIFLSNLSQITWYAVLFFNGYTLIKLSQLLKSFRNWRQIYPTGAAIGQILIAISLWQMISVFAPLWQPAEGLGLILFIAMLAAAISNIGYYGANLNNRFLRDSSEWLKSGPAAKFLIAGLITTYFVFVRPALMDFFPYGYIIEWLIILFAAWRVFSEIKGVLNKRYCFPIKDSDFESHVQKVDDLVDEDFTKLIIIQDEFVERSHRRDLLAYLSQLLKMNGLAEVEINQSLLPIIEYSDKKIPWYYIWHWRRDAVMRNRYSRRLSLDKTMDTLASIIHPAQSRK